MNAQRPMWTRLVPLLVAAAALASPGVASAALFNAAPDWTGAGSVAGQYPGYQMHTADLNADGYDDLISALAPVRDTGKLAVYFGSASGLTTPVILNGPTGDQFGSSINDGPIQPGNVTAADVNCDGYRDVVVGVPNNDAAGYNTGSVWIFYASATGVSTSPSLKINGSFGSSASFGGHLGGLGKVKGAGQACESFAVQARGQFGSSKGTVAVFHGTPGGPVQQATTYTGNVNNDWFGESIIGPGDLNGDGFADMVVGSHNMRYNGVNQRGTVRVYLGSASGLGSSHVLELGGTGTPNERYGRNVQAVGDLNGDGLADVGIYDQNGHDANELGVLHVYYGTNAGTGIVPTPAWSFSSVRTRNFIAGDFNNDGKDDLAISGDFGPTDRRGQVDFFLNTGSGLPATPSAADALSGWFDAQLVGYYDGEAGDFNGDGQTDLVLGHPWKDGGKGELYGWWAAPDPCANVQCDDSDPCTDDTCEAGNCDYTENTAACDDGNACTTVDACNAGVCEGTTAPNCDDNNVCTADSCAAATGCVNTPVQNGVDAVASKDLLASELNDGSESNPNGVWTYGYAAPGNIEQNFVPMQAAHHTDEWYQTPGVEGWVNQQSVYAVPMVVVNTNPGPQAMPYGITVPAGRMLIHPGVTNSSTHYVVVRYTAPASGTFTVGIQTQKLHFGVSRSYVFKNGVLVPGTTVTSSDAGSNMTIQVQLNTGDHLDFATDAPSGYGGTSTGFEATVKAPATPCDDGDACTTPDTCTDGACAGTAVSCDDNNPCTADSCDTVAGCVNTANTAACDDGNACTTGDACASGTCAGAAVSCDDSNPCTTDSCNTASGCVNAANTAACDDGDACTTNDACANSACVGGAALNCDDNNVCTNDTCNPASGCLNTAGATSYGTAVNQDRLLGYWSMDQTSGSMLDSSGNNHHAAPQGTPMYNQPSLLPSGAGKAVRIKSTGTRFATAPFQKWTAGSTGYTMSYWIKINSMPAGGSPYTQAWGDGESGGDFYMMQYLQRTSATSACPRPHYGANLGGWDPSPCTLPGGSALTVGQTHHVVISWDRPMGKVYVWVDGQKFTLHNKPTGVPAHTNNVLWLGHDNRELQSGWDITLDEVAFWDRPLTDTEVNEQQAIANGTPCEDGDACTTGDACADGSCQAGGATDCDDSNVCTTDSCNAASGCVHSANTAACNDGDACTTSDTCANKACVGGAAPSCDDNNVCTTDSCSSATGCVNSANAAPCNDGNACTTSDTCANAVCVGGSAPNCDDNSACTADSCDTGSGCVNTPIDNDGDGVPNCSDNCPNKANADQKDSDGAQSTPHNPGTGCSAVLCSGHNFTGNCQSFGPGIHDYPAVNGGVGNDTTRSVKVIGAGAYVELWQHYTPYNGQTFTGAHATFTANDGNTDDNGIGGVSSLVVVCADAPGDGVGDVCDNCPTTLNADQADANNNGIGDVCDDCPFQGGVVQNGTSACADDGTKVSCSNGQLTTTSCGQDTCSDSGDASGGGSCSATNYYCDAGACKVSNSAGTDTCGGTGAAPSVTTYACNSAGNACVANAPTANVDSCADNGNSYGGGSCGATDWTCAGGKLSSTSTSGIDTCGGDAASPSVTTYACAGGNACVASTTTETDSCSDSGDGYGGGSCAATDWTCSQASGATSPGVLASSSSQGTDTCGGSADAPSVSAYACVGGNTCAATVTAKADTCGDSGDSFGGGSCSATDWTCAAGTLSSTGSSGSDVCTGDDTVSVTSYACTASNGSVADTCVASTSSWTDSCSDTGGTLGGGSCTASDWTCSGSVATHSGSAGTDVCGGDADAPTVSYQSCKASDGSSADTCVAAVTERADSCTDTGTPSGGGACTATNWLCNDGQLSAINSNGVDTCGDGSTSQTDYHICTTGDGQAADTCTSVPDNVAPTLACPGKITVDCTRFTGVSVGVLANSGDVCDDAVVVTNSHTSGGVDATGNYPIGTTTVTFTAVDDAGNKSTCTTDVEVVWSAQSFAIYANDKKGVSVKAGATVNGEVFSADQVQVHNGATINGASFSLHGLSVYTGGTITGGAYATGTVKLHGTATFQGAPPAGIPAPPMLNDAGFQAQLTAAKAESKGNVKKKGTFALAGGTLLVNGNFDLDKLGTLTGPGTVVATKHIRIKAGSVIGAGVTLVAGGHVQLGEGVAAGDDLHVFSAKDVKLKGGSSTGDRALLLSLGKVDVHSGATVSGLIYAEGDVKVHSNAFVKGSIVSLGDVSVHCGATVTHDCEALPAIAAVLEAQSGTPSSVGSDSDSKSGSKSGGSDSGSGSGSSCDKSQSSSQSGSASGGDKSESSSQSGSAPSDSASGGDKSGSKSKKSKKRKK